MVSLSEITDALNRVAGVEAIALGGSRSRGENHESSDIDIGLYYNADALDTEALSGALRELDDGGRDGLLNAPGQWGPWINGGAWLTAGGTPVDILLRDIAHVEKTIRECVGGTVTIHYQSGHPFGFVNTIYAAETHFAQPLWQSGSRCLDRLKSLLYSEGGYSPAMRDAVTGKFLWEAAFSLSCGRKSVPTGDVNYAVGSAFRAVCAWAQVLYALNGRYLMNEKGALKYIGQFDRTPQDMTRRVNEAYRLIGNGDIAAGYAVLDALQVEIAALVQNTPA